MQKSAESPEQIRIRIREQRKRMTAPVANAAALAACQRLVQIPEFQAASKIAAYAAINGEIETAGLIDEVWRQNKQLYLPVLGDSGDLLFALYEQNSRLRPNRFHIPEPEIMPQNPLLRAPDMDILIVPLIAFDDWCHRIGMGAGYYDRTLAGNATNKPLRIGLAYELQRVSAIQPEAWDVPMHKIVTERQIYTRPDQ
ncbi:MAG TPA: 5-formyltetrahydrofolate cyclo-ligase [Gammaproteobacteria bacterium]